MTRKRLPALATNLRRIRTERGYTQESLAEAAGYTRQAIQRVEVGRCGVTLKGLAAIAAVLKVPASELLVEHPTRTRAA